jgi:hypothetical protein
MRSIKPTTIRLSEEDLELVEKVKRQYGQSSLIGAIRTALRVSINQTNVATSVADADKQSQSRA